MKHLFVPYEIALQLKEKGFDEPCLGYLTKEAINLDKEGNKTNFVLLSEKLRGELSGQGTCKNSLFQWLKDNDRTTGELYILSNSVSAPLYQQVVDWFREKHRIELMVKSRINGEIDIYLYSVNKFGDSSSYRYDKSYVKYSYYEALNQAIEEALKLI